MAGSRQVFTPGNTSPLAFRVQPRDQTVRVDVLSFAFTGAAGQLQGSNDGQTWRAVAVIDLGTLDSVTDLTAADGKPAAYAAPVEYRQYRFVPSRLTGGTLVVSITGQRAALSPIVTMRALEQEQQQFAPRAVPA